MALPTSPDIGRHPEPKMSATESEVKITFERKTMAKRDLYSHCNIARLADIARLQPATEVQE